MNNSNSPLEKITDTITDVISGVPAPIRKNFFKAFGQLCTAAVDVPVTWLEGKASEIRATYEARIQIIKKEGESISDKLEVPPQYIAKASEKFASKIIKEQLNLDQITHNAAQNLADHRYESESERKEETAEISDDWLNEFENYARLKSSEDMKTIFGKILSGEILKPGTFSIKTVRLISQLDNQAAKLFQILCSIAATLEIGGLEFDTRVISIGGDAGGNSLSKFGLSFDDLNILQEYGLIIADYNSYFTYLMCVANEQNQVSGVLRFRNKPFGFVPIDREKYDKQVKLNGVAFTKAARELRSIIPLIEVGDYEKELIEFFEKKHLRMVEVR